MENEMQSVTGSTGCEETAGSVCGSEEKEMVIVTVMVMVTVTCHSIVQHTTNYVVALHNTAATKGRTAQRRRRRPAPRPRPRVERFLPACLAAPRGDVAAALGAAASL